MSSLWKNYDVEVEVVVTYRFDNLSIPDPNIIGRGVSALEALRSVTEFAGLDGAVEYRYRLYRHGKLIKKLVSDELYSKEMLETIYKHYYAEELGDQMF